MTEEAVQIGLKVLSTGLRFEVDEQAATIFPRLLSAACQDVSDREWQAFVTHAVLGGAFSRALPSIPEVLSALKAFRSVESSLPEADAQRAYERVLSCNTYTPEGGAVWTWRQIRDECGAAAAEAFLAAGGNHAFCTAYREGERRRAFIDASKKRSPSLVA